MEIMDLLDDLEALGEEGERWYRYLFPFLLRKTIIDADLFFETVARLRQSLPTEMTTANQVARDREKIVREAHEERAKILESAREQAQLLISNDVLVKEAEEKAQEILRQARVEAEAIRAEAEAWARGVIERLENYITRTQGTLEKAKKALAGAPAGPTRADMRGHPDD